MTDQKFQTQLKRVLTEPPDPCTHAVFERAFGQLLHTFAETHYDEPLAPFTLTLTLQSLCAMMKVAWAKNIPVSRIQLQNFHGILKYHEKISS
jgi:hypothetical protein